MNAHFSNISQKCYYELRRLASIRRFLTSTATATLASAFVLSRIDYCNTLLFGSTHDVTSHLQRIQNYAAQVILRIPMSSNITTYIKSLHWILQTVTSTMLLTSVQVSLLGWLTRSTTIFIVEERINNNWLPVKVRSTYKIACLFYQCHSRTAPSFVADMRQEKPSHTRNTSSS